MGLDYLSDNLIELRGPVNVATDTAVDNGSSCIASLYDTNLDCRIDTPETYLTADAIQVSLTVFVQDRTLIKIGTFINVFLDNGAIDLREVNAVPGSDEDGEVTFSPGLSFAASERSKVEVVSYPGSAIGKIKLDDISGWENIMTIEITSDDGTITVTTTAELSQRDSTCLIFPVPASDWSPGNLVKRKLGADITMASFGTFPTSNPVPGDPAWGFRGVIEYNHADLELGMRVRAEITLIDTVPSPDLNLTRKVVGTLINQ